MRFGRRRRHLGVWDPTGGEAREGSGLPVEEGAEKVRILYRGPEDKVQQISPEEVEEVGGEGVLWIDLVRPQERAEALLRDVLKLPPLTVEDCLAPLRMPKIDLFSVEEIWGVFGAAFAVQVEREEALGPRAIEVDLVAGPNYLVTVRDGPMPEVTERLERRLRSGESPSGDTLAYEVLDALIDGHLPALVQLSAAAEELEESLDPGNERSSVEALENLISLRRDLAAFRRLALAQQELLRRLGRSSAALRDYLSDVADNQREAIDMADATRDYVEGAVEAYRIRRDERSELGIRRLTVVAAVLGPLALISGIYGANFVRIPGTQSPYGFPVFVGVQVVFAIIAVWFLHRRGLI